MPLVCVALLGGVDQALADTVASAAGTDEAGMTLCSAPAGYCGSPAKAATSVITALQASRGDLRERRRKGPAVLARHRPAVDGCVFSPLCREGDEGTGDLVRLLAQGLRGQARQRDLKARQQCVGLGQHEDTAADQAPVLRGHGWRERGRDRATRQASARVRAGLAAGARDGSQRGRAWTRAVAAASIVAAMAKSAV